MQKEDCSEGKRGYAKETFEISFVFCNKLWKKSPKILFVRECEINISEMDVNNELLSELNWKHYKWVLL